MFINALGFINSSVVYMFINSGGGGGGGGGGGVLEHKLKSPPPPPLPPAPPPRLRYGIYDLRMSCVTVTVLCGFSLTAPRSPKCLRISPTSNT